MSSFGHIYRVTTYGESHCPSVGAIIDGCPPVIAFDHFHISLIVDVSPGFTTLCGRHTETAQSQETRTEQSYNSCRIFLFPVSSKLISDDTLSA